MVKNFKFKTEIVVRFEDIDLFGVVNNAKYFNYFERSRIEYLRNLGFVGGGPESVKNFESVVVENYCSYKKPAKFDDILQIHVRISFMKRSSLQFQYYITKNNNTDILSTGFTTLVWYNSVSFKPKPIPDSIKTQISDFEGESLGKMIGNPEM